MVRLVQHYGTFRLILGMLPGPDRNAAAMHHDMIPRLLNLIR